MTRVRFVGADRGNMAMQLMRIASFAVLLAAGAVAQSLEPARVFDMNRMRGRDHANVLGLSGAAYDASRGIAYAASVLTRRCAVIDVAAGRVLRVFDLPFPRGVREITLQLNAAGWMLLARGDDDASRVLGINVVSGARVAEFRHPAGLPLCGLVVDAAQNRVYVSDGTPIVRILDGTSLRQRDSIVVPDVSVGPLAFDSARVEIVAASSSLSRGRTVIQTMYVGRPPQLFRNFSFRSTEPARGLLYDPADRRIAIVSAHGIHIFTPAGVIQRNIPVGCGIVDAAMLPARGVIVVTDSAGFRSEGEGAVRGKLLRIRLEDGAVDSLRIGFGTAHLAAAPESGVLLVFSSGSNSIMSIADSDGTVLSAVDPGESAGPIAASSLGIFACDIEGEGNAIACVRLPESVLTMTTLAYHPAGIAYDESLQSLIAYEHGTSTLKVYPDRDLVTPRTLRIAAFPEGRDATGAHLSYDPVAHLALICVPELGRWALVDVDACAVTATGDVEGARIPADAGPGALQGAIASAHDRFFVLDRIARRLHVYQLSTGIRLSVADLGLLQWSRLGNTAGDALESDARFDRLFAGPFVFDAVEPESPEAEIAGSGRFIGTSPDGKHAFVLDAGDDSVRLVVCRNTDLRVEQRLGLFAYSGGLPSASLMASSHLLYVSDPVEGVIREYAVGMLEDAEQDPAPEAFGLSIAPNPAWTGHPAVLTMTGAVSRIPTLLTVSDILGRVVMQLRIEPGARTAVLPADGLAPGMYVVTLQRGPEAASAVYIIH